MRRHEKSCPMDARRFLDQYFLENRSRLLDIAAFLDRFDRTADQGQSADFRINAFRDGLKLVLEAPANRVERLQKMLSDPRFETRDRPPGGGTTIGAFEREGTEE